MTTEEMINLLHKGYPPAYVSIKAWTIRLNIIINSNTYNPRIVESNSTCALCWQYGKSLSSNQGLILYGKEVYGDMSCNECPLEKVNHGCLEDSSTYHKILDAKSKEEVVPLIIQLLTELNKAFEWEYFNNIL